MKKNISPHVNIYKFPITAISSISTRLSGLYLTGVFIGGGLYCLNGNNLEEKYNSLSKFQQRLVNISLIIPTTYHTFGGLRHFIWDKYPKLLQNNKVAKSSYALFGITILSSLLIEYKVKNY